MSYPDLPNNRLIVNGEDLTEKFKIVLCDGYTLSPPKPKTYVVDIPGGNGKLDLTESLLGDVAYNNRTHEFSLYFIATDNFERDKTLFSNYLHGRSFDYKITMDPEYTYHGRFTVSSYEHGVYHLGKVGVIKVSVDTDPYKYKDKQIFKIDGVGGNIVRFQSGRMPVSPTIVVDGSTKVIFNNTVYRLTQGSWVINDIIFHEGENELYINTYDIRNYRWGDFKTNNVTWGQFKKKRLYEWYKSNGEGTYVYKTWEEVSENTWNDLSPYRWIDLQKYIDTPTDVKQITIKYDWGDL